MAMKSVAIAFDACVLINILASGRSKEIIKSLECPTCICTAVEKEILYLGRKKILPSLSPSPLDSLVEDTNLTVNAIESDKEREDFVEYSRQIGKGEAMTIAIASTRQWAVATDDKKAIRIATSALIHGRDSIWTTPDVIRYWVDTMSPSQRDASQAIRRIERIGRYRPPARHALREWWNLTKEVVC